MTYTATIQGNYVQVAWFDHKTETVVSWDSIQGVKIEDRSPEITAIGIVHPPIRTHPVTIIGTVRDIQIYDVMKRSDKPIFKIKLENMIKKESESRDSNYIGGFCKGISLKDNAILIGTHTGEIIVILCHGEAHFTTKKNLKGHTQAVVGIATCVYDDITVSCSANEEIIVWQKSLKGIQSKIETNENISAVNILRKQIIIGTMRGIVQLYSVATGALMCETTAHARVVTSISVAPESAYILTSSEDGIYTVSKLYTRKPHPYELEYRFSKKHQHPMIVGAQFMNPQGNMFALVAFDHPQISVFKIPTKVEPSSSQKT
ncbi:unnamed protein product [Caenorhabditis bovis]|uniref:WD repeat-containing protein 54 beta-propeller domain-containing protein n=1 Tax=Caenorhabditis bovis TaxID=2654633 RepID=A0A8S1EJH0_9PELO|nr:unnamed protein product [Caenorhabditis bovis]